MGWFIVYIITIIIANVVTDSMGYDVRTWQYWVITLCIMLARLSGSYNSKD